MEKDYISDLCVSVDVRIMSLLSGETATKAAPGKEKTVVYGEIEGLKKDISHIAQHHLAELRRFKRRQAVSGLLSSRKSRRSVPNTIPQNDYAARALSSLVLLTVKHSPIDNTQRGPSEDLAMRIMNDLEQDIGKRELVKMIDTALRLTYYDLYHMRNFPIGQKTADEKVTSPLEAKLIARFEQTIDGMASDKERIEALTERVSENLSYGDLSSYEDGLMPKGFSDQTYRELRARKIFKSREAIDPKDRPLLLAGVSKRYPHIVPPPLP
jgi:hypothetical protein